MKNLSVATFLILAGLVGFVREANGKVIKATAYTLPDASSSGPSIPTDEEWKAADQAAEERGKRTIAQSDSVDEKTALSQSYRDLRDELNGAGNFKPIKTPEELDAFLSKIDDDAYYAKQDPDAQLAIAQLSTLRVWRSFYNRSMELMGSSSFTHSAVVSVLRFVATGVNVYFPTDQWKAGIAYVSMPVTGKELKITGYNCHHVDPRYKKTIADLTTKKLVYAPIPNYCSDIRTDLDFQDFLALELIPSLERAAGRIDKISFANKAAYWDNQFINGKTSFLDVNDHDRFLIFGEAERHSLLSTYWAGLSALNSVVSYNLDGFFKVWEEIGRVYGVGGIFLPDTASAKTRAAIIRRMNVSRGFLNLNPNAKTWLDNAYKDFKKSIIEADLSWTELKKGSVNNMGDRALLNPQVFAPYGRVINLGLNNMKSLVASKNHQQVGSAVFGTERVDVKIRDLFDFNTAPKNLTDFLPLPDGFDKTPYKTYVNFNGVTREVHNYNSGMPIAWDVSKFSPYFNVSDSEGVKRAARILSQTWGGWIIGFPMSAVVF